jgi:hypothetical protein
MHGPSVLTTSVGAAAHSAMVGVAPSPQDESSLSFHPRDIFHVPKPSLV